MFLEHIKSMENMTRLSSNDEIKQNDPIVLAYIGDTLYDLYVRTRLVYSGDYRAGQLHRMTIQFVCAKGQSIGLHEIVDILDEHEENVVRRARNAKATPPKNCDPAIYKEATSFEALCGYLYLSGEEQRLITIFDMAFNAVKNTIKGDNYGTR